MKFLSNISLIFLCVGLFLTSCNKENTDDILVTEDPNYQAPIVEVNNLVNAMTVNTNGGLDLGCISINYPFELLLESSATVSINSEADFLAAIDPQATDPAVDYVFPLSVTDSDDNTTQVDDTATLGASFASCIPTNGWNTSMTTNEMIPAFLFDNICFELVYPVNLEDGDGNAYTANNEAELIDLCATVDDLFFVLPMDILDADGNQTTISTTDEFFTALFECEGISPPVVDSGLVITGFGCNQIQFPFNVTTDNGTVTVNDADEYAALILSGTAFEIQYPFSLTNMAGDILVINNFDDVILALIDCGVNITITPSNTCDVPAHILLFFNQGTVQCGYQIDFPVQLVAGGATSDINNMDDYFIVYNAYSWDEVDMVYPVTVTIISDGSTLTFNSDDDVCTFIDGC